jgi:hypothetical protein
MNTIFILTVATVVLWANSETRVFVNKFYYTSMERCIKARTYVERDRGQPEDKAFRVKHVGNCIKRTRKPNG